MLKLLMVDDEQWVRERFTERIPWSDAGFIFMGAASRAEEAIRMIEQDMPHVLLTDITMPNMNGLELAEYVRKRWPRIRIIILTAYSEFEYARQAIGLGVNNYLIKLAQTPEQILAACRIVAEEIEREMDVDLKLEMRRKLEWEQEWTRKRQWTKWLVDKDRSINDRGFPGEWFEGMGHASFLVGLTIGWSMPVNSEQFKRSEEELVQLQKQIGQVLEERLDQRTIGPGCELVILPIGQSRLSLIIGSKQPLEIFHLNRIAFTLLEHLRSLDSMKSFIHIGPVRELGKQLLTGKLIADELLQGLDGIAAYFYNPNLAIVSKHETVFRRLDEELIREWGAAVVKALQRENAEAFREAVSIMTMLSDPPIHPTDLLELTRQMLHPGFVKLPASVIELIGGIDELATWTDYCEWWTATIHAIIEWLNNRSHPPVTVRREVQLMCRYIREHYQEDVQAVELAELVQMHPSYAGQMFKQEVGENVSEYLNRVRMDKASELLEQTTMKIYEVSGAVGISDYRYFCKLFKSYTGFTPTKYKKDKYEP